MKTTELMNALGAEDLKEVNGGMVTLSFILADHIHCIQPEPGTCSCSPRDPFAKHDNF